MPRKAASKATGPSAAPASRSILVTDAAADAPTDVTIGTDTPQEAMSAAPVVSRTAKTIEPLATEPALPEQPATVDAPTDDTAQAAATPEPAEPAATDPTPMAAPETSEPLGSVLNDPSQSQAAKQAASDKQAAAIEARNQELEALVVSGKYAVPINAVRRKRSRMLLIVFAAALVLLAVAAVDILADVGSLHLSSNVPHTHIFSD